MNMTFCRIRYWREHFYLTFKTWLSRMPLCKESSRSINYSFGDGLPRKAPTTGTLTSFPRDQTSNCGRDWGPLKAAGRTAPGCRARAEPGLPPCWGSWRWCSCTAGPRCCSSRRICRRTRTEAWRRCSSLPRTPSPHPRTPPAARTGSSSTRYRYLSGHREGRESHRSGQGRDTHSRWRPLTLDFRVKS